jgi:hypothetical protein
MPTQSRNDYINLDSYCDSTSNTDSNLNPYCDSTSDTDSNLNAYCDSTSNTDSNLDSDCDSKSNTDSNLNAYCDSNSSTNINCNSNSNSNSNSNCNSNSTSQSGPKAKRTLFPGHHRYGPFRLRSHNDSINTLTAGGSNTGTGKNHWNRDDSRNQKRDEMDIANQNENQCQAEGRSPNQMKSGASCWKETQTQANAEGEKCRSEGSIRVACDRVSKAQVENKPAFSTWPRRQRKL